MSYLHSNLQPGEEVKYVADVHFFIFVRPAILLLLGYSCSSVPKETLPLMYYIGLFLLVSGAISLIQRLLLKLGAVYAVTNKRVILKTGIISRQALDLKLDKCESLHINQSFFGRIFNYGTISVMTAGSKSDYPFIAKPLTFRMKINEQTG